MEKFSTNFAECRRKALGKMLLRRELHKGARRNGDFAEGQTGGSRQRERRRVHPRLDRPVGGLLPKVCLCREQGSREIVLCRALFFAEGVALGEDVFTEWYCLLRTTLGKGTLRREPDFLLSAKHLALGNVLFSGSDHIVDKVRKQWPSTCTLGKCS